MPAAPKPSIPLAFRVGVTGAIALDGEVAEALRLSVATLLQTLQSQLEALAKEPWAAAVHGGPTGEVRVEMRMISPIAEGADRLVAEEALKLGYQLTVPLPFDQAEYEKDFPKSVDRFRSLLGQAQGRVLALDGGRGADEWRSYEAVGRLVVRNCDLVVALWDDQVPPKGRGGTEDTVRFAANAGMPVWWLHASGKKEPVLVTDITALRDHSLAPQGPAAWTALAALVDRSLRPPPPAPEEPHGMIHRLTTYAQEMLHLEPDPLLAYLRQKPLPQRWIWRSHRRFINAVTSGQEKLPNPPPAWVPPKGFWSDVYTPADTLSSDYAARYRSSYVVMIWLAAFTLTFAALALAMEVFQAEALVGIAAALEFVAALCILVFVFINYVDRWHERWVGYRLFAELCRKQQALAVLGWSLPTLEVTRATGEEARRGAWVAWYFDAAVRAAPLATGRLGGPQLAAARDGMLRGLYQEQTFYHTARKRESAYAAERLQTWGEYLFVATLAFIALKLVLLVIHHSWPEVFALDVGVTALGTTAAILPAVSAALFGIRSYAELEVLVDQSERMLAVLSMLDSRLSAIDIDRPLASQDLGVDLFHLTSAMLADVAGWAQVFRMKAVEAG